MALMLTTQEQLDAFAEAVARHLGTHCRTDELTGYGLGIGRLIVDGDGRALRMCQPDEHRPDRLKIYAALPDESRMTAPHIGVTALSARHVAREITRRLYPQHAEAMQHAAELTARQAQEESSRRAVAQTVTAALPGARVNEQHRYTEILWERTRRPSGQLGPAGTDSVCATVGPSGEWVKVETTSAPGSVIRMLAAFAQSP
ncbi:hypothetical protein [Streptomyces sp. Tu102]|uniref:hypothetical protein n=1 Tax=Streptomyces TaxID=1883 RepID=UPI001BDD75B8|nr:hypothetical protein [Streptomyces sp. Tu102]MBT1098165.1 hypothetical protein [Streptomyces sp. Tu102]